MDPPVAMICEDCVKGYRIPGQPKGQMITLGQHAAYSISSPQTGKDIPESQSKACIIILTDVFGLPLENPKIMADIFSERLNMDVFVPDMFAGKPPVTESQLGPFLSDTPGAQPLSSFSSKLAFVWKALGCLPGLIRNRPGVLHQRMVEVISSLQKERGYEKLALVGYCLGGTVAATLATTDLVSTAIIAHPGNISPRTIADIKVSTCWIFAEEDRFFTPETVAKYEATLGEKSYLHECVTYKGTTHGFAARPNLGIPIVKAAFEQAMEQSIQWLRKTWGEVA